MACDHRSVALARVGARAGRCATVAALSAVAGVAALGAAPAGARTIEPRAATYVDAGAPRANFSAAAYLRFAVPAGGRPSTLRLYARRAVRQRIAVRASSCAWAAERVTSRTGPRPGRALAVNARVVAGWNTFALPKGTMRAGSTGCLQVTTSGRGLVRFRAGDGAGAPRLVLRGTAGSASPGPGTTPPTAARSTPGGRRRRRPAGTAPRRPARGPVPAGRSPSGRATRCRAPSTPRRRATPSSSPTARTAAPA